MNEFDPNNKQDKAEFVEELWRSYLTTGEPPDYRKVHGYRFQDLRRVMKWLPSDPRCFVCDAPFEGIGGKAVRLLLNRRPSSLNPRMCNLCELFAEEYQGGAEIELSMVFADVRGSTPLAESMSSAEFSHLLNRFYNAATEVLVESNALIEKMIGDEVTGLFVPGFAGPDHARVAIEAAQAVLRATGHTDSEGPWIPVGVGVHTGRAYVGSVGEKGGLVEITALGDAVNLAARLASMAAQGEVLVSQDALRAAGMRPDGFENRALQLKGKSETVNTYVITI